MMIQSAIDFNLEVNVMDPDPTAPCSNLANEFVKGDLKKFEDVLNFGKNQDVITVEIEKVNTEALGELEKLGKKVYPQPNVIALIQDKRKQKAFYKANRIPTADFVLTENREEIKNHIHLLPAVNKLGRDGYDGRGVQVLRTSDDLNKAFDQPSLLEELVDFEKELSVVVARNADGEVRCFPVVELSYHPEANLVEFLFAPAQINEDIQQKAFSLAREVIEKIDMIGLLAVEMFLTKEGDLLVNEIAPRTHNSGHHTIEANVTSQFEQHLRSILNFPLGDPRLKSPAVMVNVLGEEGYSGRAIYRNFEKILAMEGVHVHLYGKKNTKPFRKMGHITLIGDDLEELITKARTVKSTLKVIA